MVMIPFTYISHIKAVSNCAKLQNALVQKREQTTPLRYIVVKCKWLRVLYQISFLDNPNLPKDQKFLYK